MTTVSSCEIGATQVTAQLSGSKTVSSSAGTSSAGGRPSIREQFEVFGEAAVQARAFVNGEIVPVDAVARGGDDDVAYRDTVASPTPHAWDAAR